MQLLEAEVADYLTKIKCFLIILKTSSRKVWATMYRQVMIIFNMYNGFLEIHLTVSMTTVKKRCDYFHTLDAERIL